MIASGFVDDLDEGCAFLDHSDVVLDRSIHNHGVVGQVATKDGTEAALQGRVRRVVVAGSWVSNRL